MLQNFLRTGSVFIVGFLLIVNANAEISSNPTCVNSVISITVDDLSTLSASAVISLDGVSMTGAHTLSNSNKTISATHSSACDSINASAIKVIDGSTTHQ